MKLNLGGGPNWQRDGWTNLDLAHGYDLGERLLSGFDALSVERIFCSHSLEHLPVDRARALLADCHRVLVKGGIIRLALPDCARFTVAFFEKDMKFFERDTLKPHFKSARDCFINMGGNPESFDRPSTIGHYFFYDVPLMVWMLTLAGFSNLHVSQYGKSEIAEMREIATLDETGMPVAGFDNPLTEAISFYVEAIR